MADVREIVSYHRLLRPTVSKAIRRQAQVDLVGYHSRSALANLHAATLIRPAATQLHKRLAAYFSTTPYKGTKHSTSSKYNKPFRHSRNKPVRPFSPAPQKRSSARAARRVRRKSPVVVVPTTPAYIKFLPVKAPIAPTSKSSTPAAKPAKIVRPD